MKKILLAIIFMCLLISQSHAAACTRYWVGGGSSATWAATGNTNWGTASNTQDNASVPGASDVVCFDGVGTGASNSTLNASISIAELNMTGYSNTLTHATATTLTVSGDVKFSSTMTYSPATSTSLISINAACNFTSAGKSPQSVTFNATGATFNMMDALSLGNTFTLSAGNFVTNGYAFAAATWSSSNSGTRTINACGSTMTFPTTGTPWNMATSTNATFLACAANNQATIAFTNTSASTKTFAGGGKTYQNFTITGGGTGAVIITGANTFGTVTIGSPKTVTLPAATITEISSLGCTGTAGNLITINSSSGGSQATLRQRTGRISCDYLDLTDSKTDWVATYAGSHSNNTSNNTGWIFNDAPTITRIARLYKYSTN